MKQPTVYILSNKKNGTLYAGVTADLIQRVFQHKYQMTKGFSAKYGCRNLVYFESYETMGQAIMREKQIKGGSRKKKLKLIESMNPQWDDLYEKICIDL